MLSLYDRLGTISHSSDGSNRLQKENGFPKGGFKLYRRIQSRQVAESSKIDFEKCNNNDVVIEELLIPFYSEDRSIPATSYLLRIKSVK